MVGGFAVAALVLAGCGSPSPSPSPSSGAATPVNVVAATNVWGDIAEQIGGARVAVTSILSDPNADPHTYESDAATAGAVSKGQLVIENGLGYYDFMDTLLAASPDENRRVLNAADVMGISGTEANPHVWYRIDELPAVATAIGDQLAAIATMKARYPGARVGYTERVAGYLVEAAGLVLGTPASFARSIEDGNDPSVADNTAMNAALTEKTIKALLYNGQVTSPATDAVKQLAQASGIPVVSVTETIPRGDDGFQAWQLRQIDEITKAMGGEDR